MEEKIIMICCDCKLEQKQTAREFLQHLRNDGTIRLACGHVVFPDRIPRTRPESSYKMWTHKRRP